MPDIMTTLGGWVSTRRQQYQADMMPVLQMLDRAQQSAQRQQDENKSWNAVGEYAKQIGMEKEFQAYTDRTKFTPESAAQAIQRAADTRYKNAQATYLGVNPSQQTPISLAPFNLVPGTPEANAYQEIQIERQQAQAKSDQELSDYRQKLQLGLQADILKEQALAPGREEAEIRKEKRRVAEEKAIIRYREEVSGSGGGTNQDKIEQEAAEYSAAEASLRDAAGALGISFEDFVKNPKQYYRQLKARNISTVGIEKDLSAYRKYSEKVRVGTLQQIDWSKLGEVLKELK